MKSFLLVCPQGQSSFPSLCCSVIVSVFEISFTIFVSSKISIWFYFVFSISFLRFSVLPFLSVSACWNTTIIAALKSFWAALAAWLSWLDCSPIHQEVLGSIPTQGAYRRQQETDQCFFPSPSLSSSLRPLPPLKSIKTETQGGLKTFFKCPGWCGSVGWVLACERKLAGSISGEDACLCCQLGPWLRACKGQPHADVSLAHRCFSPSQSLSPLSKKHTMVK